MDLFAHFDLYPSALQAPIAKWVCQRSACVLAV